MNAINWFDIVVIGIIVLFGLRGLTNGIIKEVFGILGLIGGLFLAVRYKEIAGQWISANIYDLSSGSSITGSGTEVLAGFLVVLFSVWILCLILGEILAKLIGATGLSIIDRLGGFLFSSAKIFLIFSVLAVLIHASAFLNKQTKPYFEKSITYPYLLHAGNTIMQIGENQDIKNTLEEAKDNFSGMIQNELNATEDNKTNINNDNLMQHDFSEQNTTQGVLQ